MQLGVLGSVMSQILSLIENALILSIVSYPLYRGSNLTPQPVHCALLLPSGLLLPHFARGGQPPLNKILSVCGPGSFNPIALTVSYVYPLKIVQTTQTNV